MANAAKRVTLEELQQIVRDVAEAQRKTEKAQQETRKAQRKTEESLRESQKKTEESLRESQKKTEESLRESQKKTEESFRESWRETKAAIKELTRNINKATGDFNNKWGRFMETLIKGDLVRLLREKNIEVSRVQQRMEYLRPGRIAAGEIDLVAIDGDVIVAFEIKSKLLRSDVKEFLQERVSKFTHHFPEYKGRMVYGGVGFLEAEENAAAYAEREGLFVIKAGEGEAKVSAIINADGFIPKRFSD